jgi:ribosomal protein S18 acetylase RimI-like enzyme
MPWRLGAPALHSVDDARLWQNEAGELLAFAAWQVPWAVLDYVIRSGPELAAVEDALFTWAAERFNELDRQRGHPLPYWIEARDDDIERLAAIARHGYTLDDDVGYVYLRRSLASLIPPAAPPPGFTIRPLAGATEVDAYVALHRAAFASTAMTADWRARTLRMPQYVPALDLVAVAADGALASFCVCWLDAARRLGQIEPLGVHPTYQRHGLGRALLLEAFARLRAHGATTVIVETESDRLPARQAYAAAGFEIAHRVARKGRSFA